MRQIKTAILTSFIALMCTPLQCREIVDEQFGFRFEVPEGFLESAIEESDRDSLYQLLDRDPTPDNPATVIQVQRLRGTIDPDQRLSVEDVPDIDGMTTSLEETRWNGQPIDVMRQVMEIGEVTFVVYGAQFPLPREAVQLQVGGPVEREAETKMLFERSVASFKSTRPIARSRRTSMPQPNDSNRISKLSSGIFRLSVTVIIICCIVGFIGNWIRQRRKETG